MERTLVSSRGVQAARGSRACGMVLGLVLGVVATQPSMARGQVPASGSGAGAARASLARYVPKPDLIYCAEFEAWRPMPAPGDGRRPTGS